MKNLREIKTTITGFIVWVITVFYFITPYFSDRELWESKHYELIGGFIIGLLLLLAPDRLINFMFGWLNKRK